MIMVGGSMEVFGTFSKGVQMEKNDILCGRNTESCRHNQMSAIVSIERSASCLFFPS